jgi:hypothetical protein
MTSYEKVYYLNSFWYIVSIGVTVGDSIHVELQSVDKTINTGFNGHRPIRTQAIIPKTEIVIDYSILGVEY